VRSTVRPAIAIVFTAVGLVAAAPSAPASAPAAPAPTVSVNLDLDHKVGNCRGEYFNNDVPIGGGKGSKLG
jgi:hypothetical protein